MDLSKIFKSDDDGIRRSHVKDLVAVALADGQLTTDEWDLLVYLASRLDISEEEINDIKNNPDVVRFIAPKKYEEKIQQIEDLVAVISIDHDINPKEIELCKKISLRLNILPQIIDTIIAKNSVAEKK
jgi:uncharacterized tellurite resistance protein B-like protein